MIKRKKIFYGWWIVLGAALMHFFGGGTYYYGFTVFFNPIRNAFGWTAAATSIAFTLQRLEAGVLGPVAGFFVDKLGPRKLMLFGWSVVGLGFLWMSRINSLWAFYGAFLTIAVGMSFASGLVSNTAIANWFSKKRSRALTIAFIGPGVCGILAPLLALSITKLGWRETLTVVSVALLVIGLPLSLIMRHKPNQYGYLPDGETLVAKNEPAEVSSLRSSSGITGQGIGSAIDFTVKTALKTRAFWLLSLVSFFQQVGTSAVMVHIVPYLESVNVSTSIAASAVAGMTLCSLIGRLGFGFLGDFANKRYLIATALSLQALGTFIFSLITGEKAWLIIVFLLTFGPGYGGPIPVRPALQADYFGTKSFGTILGLMALISMVGGLVSPVIAGWFYDTTGSYRLVWQLFALITIPAVPLILLAKPPRGQTKLTTEG
ncbi:MAG: MFS transporter [Chloroflexota bacterium]